MMERYPLTWPVGMPRTANRREAAFTVDLRRSYDDLTRTLSLLGARHVVVSSNLVLRQDGAPLARMAEPRDPGVAVYFDRWIDKADRPFVIACDQYSKVRWNLRAIGVTVDALRSIQRHGASSMLEQAFTGFAALPPAAREKPWWEVLVGGTRRLRARDRRGDPRGAPRTRAHPPPRSRRRRGADGGDQSRARSRLGGRVIEYELDPATFERTGRTRQTQWARRTLRREAVPPSERGDAPFVWPISCEVHRLHNTACDRCLAMSKLSAERRGWCAPTREEGSEGGG